MPQTICEQDQADAKGLENESNEVDMNTQAESQATNMETEDALITPEETVKEGEMQVPEVDTTNQESKGEAKEGADQGKGKQTTEAEQTEGDTENISSNDVEMNSQVENIDEPTESQMEN
nr:ADP-ribose glycohydrolase MACROD2-like [Anolis sagrei ordinatus]